MDSRAIAALLRLQTPLALYEQQTEAAAAALRLAIEEAGIDPGVLEASVLDVPPMPLPIFDSGLSAEAEPTMHPGVADLIQLNRLISAGPTPLETELADKLAAAQRTIDALCAEVVSLNGERGMPAGTPWEGQG